MRNLLRNSRSFRTVGISLAAAIFALLFIVIAWAETHPTAQSLPYTQDFSTLASTSTTYPAGWQGWQLSTGGPSTTFRTTAATADLALTASSSASTTSGGIHNYNGKIGFLQSGSNDPSIALAINTTGSSNIKVSYDIMTIRNPYDGTTNTRINEATLQYRVGTSGSFTTLTGIEYQNNTTTQTGSGVTTPQNSQTKSIVLPAACDNQSVVELRWTARDVSGGGSRASFAVDNIGVQSVAASSMLFRSRATGNWNSSSTWDISTDGGTTYVASAGQTPTSSNGAITIQNGHNVTVSASVNADELTVNSGGTITVSSGQTLTIDDGTGTDLTNNGTLTVTGTIATAGSVTNNSTATINGTLQINQGGFPSGSGTYSYNSSTGTLVFNNTSGTYGPIDSGHTYWPATNGPQNVTVQGAGGINLSVARTVGTLFQYAAGVSGASNLTLNGTAQVNVGGFTSGSPTYGSSSLLKYNIGTSYGRNGEWLPGVTSGAGYPANVQLSNNTTLDLPNGSTSSAFQLSGNLTIDSGSTLSMGAMSQALTALGSVTNNGTLTLSSSSGGDIKVGGSSWFRGSTGTFNPNGRAVFFNGASPTITVGGGGTETFNYLVVNLSSGTLGTSGSPNSTSIVVNGTSGDVLQMLGGNLNMSGPGLSISGNGGNILVSGGARQINGAVNFFGSKTITSASSGSLTFNAIFINTVSLSSAVDFGAGVSTIGANCTLDILSGGSVNTNAPTYASGSTLRYDNGSTYDAAAEFPSTGVQNVTLGTTTTLNLNGDKTIAGTFDAGARTVGTTGANPFSLSAATINVSTGTLNLNNVTTTTAFNATGAANINVAGNWNVTGFSAGTSTVNFNGTGSQTIQTASTFNNLTASNDLTLGASPTLNGTLALGAKNITTGANTLTIGGSGSVTRTSGYILGTEQKSFTASGNFTFDVGTANGYSPVDANSTTGTGSLSVKPTQSKQPNISGTNALSRYWTLSGSGITTNLTFHYLASDVVGTESNYQVVKYNGSFSAPANQSVNTAAHTATVNGVSSFSDWTLAEGSTVFGSLQFSAANYNDNETNATHNVTVTVQRTGSSSGAVSVHYATSDGTATAGSDYTATSGDLNWSDGDSADKTFTVSVTGDTTYETNETINLMLSSPTGGATLGSQSTSTITIQNDDAAPTLTINDVTQAEGNSGTTNFVFHVTKSGSTAVNATVNYATVDGTATSGSGDYQSTSGQLTFQPNDTDLTITVPVNGDTTAEPDETFTVHLSGETNATLSNTDGTGTIQNDDGAVTYTWNPSSVQALALCGVNPATTNSWICPANWTPLRPSAASANTTDILIFDGSVTPSPTVTNVPTQTIAALQLTNGINPLTLNAGITGPVTLTIQGGTGNDLSVPSGTLLTLNGSNGITLSLTASGQQASIGGQIIFQGGPHRLIGANAGEIVMTGANAFTTASGFTGNPFGTGTDGSVVFQSGSTAAFNAGSDPFGGAGHSIATFNLGSTAAFYTSSAFSYDGRTYGNLSLGGGQNYSGGSSTNQLTVANNLTIDSTSTLTLSSASGGDLNLLGSFTDNNQNLGSGFVANGRTVKFQGGNLTQTVFKSSNPETFDNVIISKTGGSVVVGSSMVVNGALQFNGITDVLDLSSTTLVLKGTVGGTNASGALKGNLLGSELSISGTGALGTLRFVSGGEYLTSLNVNRTSSGSVNIGTNLNIGDGSGGGVLLTNGIVDMGTNTLSLAEFPVINRTNGYVIGNVQKTFAGTGAFTFAVGTQNGYSPVDANVTAGTFPASLTVKAVQGKQPNVSGANALSRYWTLSGTGLTTNLTFHYLGTDVVGTESNYKIFRVSGGTFTQFAPTTLDTTNHIATLNGVSSFSDWTLADPASVFGQLQFSASNYNDNETNATHNVTVTVTRTGGSNGAVSVHYATSDGTATAGSDYTATSGDLSWVDGDSADKTFTVSITGDTTVEPDETINLTLSSPTGGAALGSPSTASITIQNDDTNTNPTISDIADQSVSQDNSITVPFTVGDAETPVANLTLTGASDNQTLVPDANITFGGSGANRTVTVTPAAGQTGTATITVTVHDADGATASDSFVLTVNAVSCTPAPSGMIAWYPGEGNADDIIGSSNGTLQNGATFAAGKVNQAFSFNGTNQFVDIANAAPLPSTFTIDAWVNPNSLANNPFIYAENDGLSGSHYFGIETAGTLVGSIRNTSGFFTQYRTNIAPVVAGRLQHIVMTYDGSAAADQKMKFYVDGINIPATHISTYDNGGTPLTGSGDAKIGIFGDGVTGPFGGLIDELEVFDRVLTATDVSNIYNASTAGKCHSCTPPPTGMVGWWAAEGNANDIGGTNNGTLHNGATATAAGKVGQAFGFDGQDDYVEIAPNTFDNMTNVTVDAWVKFNSLNPSPTYDSQAIISSNLPGTANLFALLKRDSGELELSFGTLPGVVCDAVQAPTIPFVAGRYYHIAVTKTGGVIKFYVDGHEIGSQSTTCADAIFPNISSNTLIGAQVISTNPTTTFGNVVDGSVDELEIFNRALTSTEIAAIADAGNAGKCHTSTIQFSSATYDVAENVPGGVATITVTREGAHDTPASVNYATVAGGSAIAGTSCAPGDDYTTTGGTLSFGTNEVSKSFTVPICNDGAFENDDTVNLQLSNLTGAGASLGSQASSVLTIHNDDAMPSFTIDDVSHVEGNPPGTTSYVFTVTKSGNTAVNSSVDFATQDGSATVADNDYQSNSGTLNFGPADTTMQVTVLVNRDLNIEPDETFTVHLSNASGASITDADGVGLIDDDDTPPPTLGNYSPTTVALGANATVTPDAAPTDTTSINVSTNSNFKGVMTANPATGVVQITNAYPAGTYNVTVKSFGTGGTVSKTFQLTVQSGTACAGTSVFNNASDVGAISGAQSIAVGDFNGDGKQDLVIPSGSSSVHIRLGNSDGTFTAAADVFVPGGSNAVAVGDFNNDGKQDLAITKNPPSELGRVAIRLGNGDGTFTAAADVFVGISSNAFLQSIAIGDFNNDGNQDFATADPQDGTVSVRMGDGAGGFSGSTDLAFNSPTTAVAIGDFNSDGKEDLAVAKGSNSASAVSIRFGDGAGGFSGSTEVAVGTGSTSCLWVALGDFNNDGNQDLAAANSNSTVSVRTGDGSGNFSGTTEVATGSGGISAVVVGDFNNDGNQDFATSNRGNTVSVRFGNGSAAFSGTMEVSVGNNVNSIAVGDFNGDGKQDFATSNNSNSVSVRLGACNFPGSLQFSAANYDTTEENTGTHNVTVHVTRTVGSTGAVSVHYATSDGTATDGSDYTATSGDLNWNDGDSADKTFTVSITGDTTFEPDETINLTLSSPTGGAVLGSANPSTITIQNDDGTPSLSIGNVSQAEGNSGASNFDFTVSLSNPSSSNVTVHYATADGTATASSDYTAVSDDTLTILAGQTTGTISISVNGDTTFEADETFTVTLSNPTNATIAAGQETGTGTIQNDDAAQHGSIQLSAATYSGTEGGGQITVTVTRTGGSDGAVAVTLDTSDGTATAGSDYTAVIGHSVMFADGDANNKTVNITINDDTDYEGPETFNVTISNPTGGATLGTPSSAVVTINDNDNPPATLVVNTTDDVDNGFCLASHCSLREAINAANSNADTSTITFNIPNTDPNFLGGVYTIKPAVTLPSITSSATVDGTSQTAFGGDTNPNGPEIVINGSLTTGANGLTLSASNSTIKGFVINGFANGIALGAANIQNNVVSDNYVGTDATGTLAVPNANVGISVATTHNTDITRNLISGNGGVGLITCDASTNNYTDNFIGTDRSGTASLGNGSHGIHTVCSTGSGNTYSGNIVAFNGGDGLRDEPDYHFGLNGHINNQFTQNSFFSNTGLGINLLPPPFGTVDGVTPNDPEDTDSGSNRLQNFPVITLARVTGSTRTVSGTLNSVPGQTFRIEVYSNSSCDSSGNGEGQTYIGSVTTAATDANGDVAFSMTPTSLVAGDFVTATAIDSSGNTSEFSQCFAVVAGTPGQIQFSSPTYSVSENGTSAAITIKRVGGSDGSVSANFSTSDGTATAGSDYTAVNTTVTFADGDAADQTVNIPISNDSVYEGDETINLTLGATSVNLPNGTVMSAPHISGDSAVLTITEDDAPPSFSIDNVSHNEGNSSTTSFVFTVTKTGATAVNASVDFTTVDGTATTADNDYQANSNTLIFGPADTTKQVTVLVNGDTTFEPDETFTVHLSNAVSASISGADGTGTITNDDSPSISGHVSYQDGSTAAKNVTMTLTGNNGFVTRQTTADENGDYTFTSVPTGNDYTITPSKTGDNTSGLESLDASNVARYVAGLDVPTASQQIAADADGDGVITSYDASLIARYVAGLNDTGLVGTWKFTPTNLSVNALSGNVNNQNFTAILVGDTSGNWTPSAPPPAQGGNSLTFTVNGVTQAAGGSSVSPTATVTVSLPNVPGPPASTVSIPITVSDLTGLGVRSYDLQVTFDSTIVQPALTPYDSSGTLSSGMLITPNATNSGHLIISAFQATDLSGSGTLLKLRFNVVGSPGQQTALSFQDYTDPNSIFHPGFRFNAGNPQASTTNGSLTVNGPTAANGVITGRILDDSGQAVSGSVVRLSGGQSRKTITDAQGFYKFDNVTTSGFYTVTPERANYRFSPPVRSFNQVGQRTEAEFSASFTGDNANPLDTPEYFVRQAYLDFLGREPDEGGFNYWSARINECGTDASCIHQRRIDVSAAYFMSDEFQQTGSFVYRLYKAAYGVMPTYQQFISDRSRVVAGGNLEEIKSAFAVEFIQRAEFRTFYPDAMSNMEFVNKLCDTAGVAVDRQQLVNLLQGGATRAEVLSQVIEDASFKRREFNPGFVLMQYFGYLRRDADSGGYQFWLDVLNNRVPGNYRSMVCAFITSTEYQKRFSAVVVHGNGECGQ